MSRGNTVNKGNANGWSERNSPNFWKQTLSTKSSCHLNKLTEGAIKKLELMRASKMWSADKDPAELRKADPSSLATLER